MWSLLLPLALANPTQMSGTWTLDREASDSVDAILAARGISWPIRQAAQYSEVTQVFTFSADTLHIHVNSSLRDTEEDLRLDGTRQSRTTDRGEPVTLWTVWEGEALVTTSLITGPDGATTRFVITRRVEQEGAVMRQTMLWDPPEGPTLSADRIFRRP